MNSLVGDARIRAALDRLHAESDRQEDETRAYLAAQGRATTVGTDAERAAGRAFWRDKFVALERDKAEFCYGLCRVRNARRVVEAGTSFGVSTIYLAAAVRDNGGGTVIGTEYEPEKAAAARRNFTEAGVADLVELREGDIRETLRDLAAPIDLLLLDIWTPVARPTIELVGPLMPTGAIALADNTTARRTEYAALLDHLADPANGFTTMTLPFAGGFEMAVKTGA